MACPNVQSPQNQRRNYRRKVSAAWLEDQHPVPSAERAPGNPAPHRGSARRRYPPVPRRRSCSAPARPGRRRCHRRRAPRSAPSSHQGGPEDVEHRDVAFDVTMIGRGEHGVRRLHQKERSGIDERGDAPARQPRQRRIVGGAAAGAGAIGNHLRGVRAVDRFERPRAHAADCDQRNRIGAQAQREGRDGRCQNTRARGPGRGGRE